MGHTNPYGPILMESEPEALLEAAEVAICLRSASGTDFDMQAGALKDVVTWTSFSAGRAHPPVRC
jgi:hypothetical protein